MDVLYSASTGQWNVTFKHADAGNIKAVTTYGTKRVNAYQIFEHTLNQKEVRIFDTVIEDEKEKAGAESQRNSHCPGPAGTDEVPVCRMGLAGH